MLETDSPWLGFGKRNDPTSVKAVAEKIAEIKKISLEEVDKITTENAINFFELKI
jgi:TatD DNase family protein